MKKRNIVFLIIGTFISLAAYAQQSEGIKDEGAHEAEYNADAQDRDHSGEIDSRQNDDVDGSENTTDVGEQTNFGATVENVIITPAGTRTTSPSGSPGIRMEDPSMPDGTNTRQSARPNIAGSPVPDASEVKDSENRGTDLPDNKIFSGEEQRSVPMSADDPQNSDEQNRKKGSQTDEMQKG
jgi:hypothetical protein